MDHEERLGIGDEFKMLKNNRLRKCDSHFKEKLKTGILVIGQAYHSAYIVEMGKDCYLWGKLKSKFSLCTISGSHRYQYLYPYEVSAPIPRVVKGFVC